MQTKSEDTLELLAPLADAEREKRAKDIMIKRKLAAEAMRKIDDEASKVLPDLEKQKSGLKQKIAEIEAASKQARSELDMVSWKKFAESQRYDREKNRHSAYLMDTFDPEISRAIEFFREKHAELMAANVDEQTRLGDLELATMTQKHHIWSNYESIRDAMKYCRDAIKTLEEWKLRPSIDYQEIEDLKASMPDPSTIREYTGTKPMKSEQEIRYHSSAEGILDAKIERSLGYR